MIKELSKGQKAGIKKIEKLIKEKSDLRTQISKLEEN